MREQRRTAGHAKLLRLATSIPEIPYIRLSKIERGEVVPRADELRRIAAALQIALSSGKAVGIELAIYDPQLDSDGQAGRGLVDCVARALTS